MAEIETELGAIEIPDLEAKFLDYKGYRGDSLLKRAGVAIEWTPDLIAEYKKCMDDPIYFIENHIKVVNLDRGLIPFILYPYQRTLIRNIHNNRNTITVMA